MSRVGYVYIRLQLLVYTSMDNSNSVEVTMETVETYF